VRVPIAVVPTGVDLACFSPGERAPARRARALDENALLILYVGRLDREKSVDRILAAFSRIAGTLPQARLVLVGQGTQGDELRRMAAGLPAAGRVTFAGVCAHEALPEYYRAADLFLFASETETQGLVLAEAAACGLPAVAVNAPGCAEVIHDGDTGVLTKGDPSALAEAAIGLLIDPARRATMALRARELAEREFDVTLQIDRTLDVYAAALARRGRASRGTPEGSRGER
jgi:glycosyltransferase involved in cell wall biosynthesis